MVSPPTSINLLNWDSFFGRKGPRFYQLETLNGAISILELFKVFAWSPLIKRETLSSSQGHDLSSVNLSMGTTAMIAHASNFS